MKWLELKQEIQAEYDIQDENFISPGELMGFVNEAIDEAETEILTLNQGQYFKTHTSFDMEDGVSEILLPSNIFATKIIGLQYVNDATGEFWPINPVKDISEIPALLKGCGEMKFDAFYKDTDPAGWAIKLYPTPTETIPGVLKLYYIRNAGKIINDESVIDLPEAIGFLKQYVLDKCANKERMTPDAEESAALKRKRKQLIESLERQFPDNNNQYPVDLSFFEGHQ